MKRRNHDRVSSPVFDKGCKRYKEVSFEDLVTNPSIISKDIFKFCGLDYSDKVVKEVIAPGKRWKYFDKINPDRAFAYKNK